MVKHYFKCFMGTETVVLTAKGINEEEATKSLNKMYRKATITIIEVSQTPIDLKPKKEKVKASNFNESVHTYTKRHSRANLFG